MKKKVRIYKAPDGKGKYINKTAKFLTKAQYGGQRPAPTQNDLAKVILDELTLDPDPDSIAMKLQDMYGLDYNSAMDAVEEVTSLLAKEGVEEMNEKLLPSEDLELEDESTRKNYDYNLDEESVVDDSNWEEESGWDDEEEYDDLAQDLPEEKKGGTIGKKKFVKTVVRGLRKAAEGMQQDQANQANILDTPIDGRQSFVNNFRRGIKDVGNEFYAKQIYDQTKQQNNMMPAAQEGIEMPKEDPHDAWDHLQAYSDSVSNIFKQPMNQVHGAGYEKMPEARMGREQRQAARQQRKMGRDWNNMFGNMAAGYFGVPGMPNYLQVVSPQIAQFPQGQAGNQPMSGPFIDVNYKKGPWWSGKREWSAKGIPAQMLMGMGAGMMPSFGYMPGGYGYGSSWNTHRTYPGEIIRRTASTINAIADPAKNEESLNLKNSGIKPYPGYMELNPAPEGTQMVYDAQGNEVEAISPDEALRRRNEKFPWMVGAGNQNAIPPAISSTSGASVMSSPEASSTNLIPQTTGSASGAGVDRYNLELISSPTKPGTYYGKDASGVMYQFSGDLSQHQLGKEPVARIAPDNPKYTEVMASIYRKQFGGVTTGVMPDQYGDLQKFVYGGDELPISPIVAYDNNDIQTKNVDDPFMFRSGGMFQYEGPEQSQVTPTTTTQPSAWKDLTEADYNAKLAEEKKKWEAEYAKGNNRVTTTNTQGGFRVGDQMIYNQGRDNYNYPAMGGFGMGYPVKPRSIFGEVMNMFNPYKKDFMWASQMGPARTMNGQVWQPPAGAMPGGQGGMKIEYPYTNPITGQTVAGPQNQQNPMQPGYMYDYTFKKGPWWKGNEKTMSLTGRWVDPNNPNASGQARDNNPIPPLLRGPEGNQGFQGSTGTTAGGQGFKTNELTRNYEKGTKFNIPEEEWDALGAGAKSSIRQGERKARRNARRYEPGMFDNYIPGTKAAETSSVSQPSSAIQPSAQSESAFPPGDPRGEYMKSQLTLPPRQEPLPEGYPINTSGPRATEEDQMAYGGYMAFGGYIPEFNPGGQFSGTGPFNPNANNIVGGMGQGLTGPCTEFEVKDPNSPCYDPNYKPDALNQPQDFQVDYKLNQAGTLSTGNIANIGAGVGQGIQTGARMADNAYQNTYLANNTGGDNRRATSFTDKTGGYGRGERPMAPMFDAVVGESSFFRRGGQLKYQMGGVYDLTQEEVGAILAAGGQIEFI